MTDIPLDPSLDPDDWASLRSQAHRMLDDMLDYVEHIRAGPVWQPMDTSLRSRFRSELPVEPTPLGRVHQDFLRDVLPYSAGNVHPGFMGWVHGGGTVVGMLAEMLAGGLNANCGGRDHAPIEIERQITEWVRELSGFRRVPAAYSSPARRWQTSLRCWSRIVRCSAPRCGAAASNPEPCK